MMNYIKTFIFSLALAGMVFGGFAHMAYADNDRGIGADVRAEAKINLLGEDRRGASDYDTYDDRDDKDRDNDRHDDKGRLMTGVVTAINGTTLSVKNNRDGMTYAVVATNAKVYQGLKLIALADIKIGDTLLIDGTLSGTTVTAVRVLDTREMPAPGNNGNNNPAIHPNNGNHYGFFQRFGLFFRNWFKVKPRHEIILATPLSLQLVAYNGANVPAAEQYVVTLKDGKLSTKFCNTMSGAYTLNNKTVTATLASTLMYCSEPQNVMTLESAFGRILSEGATVSRDANGMISITGKDNTSFTFRVVATS
jgi:heat shock protein HslJ